MSEQPKMTPEQIIEIRRRAAKASRCISDLNHQRKQWMMSIPADHERDPDIIIHDCVMDVYKLLEEWDRLRTERSKLGAALDDVDIALGRKGKDYDPWKLAEDVKRLRTELDTAQRERNEARQDFSEKLAQESKDMQEIRDLQAELETAQALNVTVESMANERMIAVGLVEKELVAVRAERDAAIKRAEQAEEQWKEHRCEHTPLVKSLDAKLKQNADEIDSLKIQVETQQRYYAELYAKWEQAEQERNRLESELREFRTEQIVGRESFRRPSIPGDCQHPFALTRCGYAKQDAIHHDLKLHGHHRYKPPGIAHVADAAQSGTPERSN